MSKWDINECFCGRLPQFGWHDLHGYNLHCFECNQDSGEAHTGWHLDKADAVKEWNKLTSKGNLADSGKERQPCGENNNAMFQLLCNIENYLTGKLKLDSVPQYLLDKISEQKAQLKQ